MEADYEPEEASSDESGSSDELSDDEEEAVPPRAIAHDIEEVSKRFGFTADVAKRISSAYREIRRGSAAEIMPLMELISEIYRYINAVRLPRGRSSKRRRSKPSRSKCPVTFWLEMTPKYLDTVEELESINQHAAFEAQTAWIHQQWDGTGEDSKAYLDILSILRRTPHPELLPRPGKEADAIVSDGAPTAAHGQARPKREGTRKPCYATKYDDAELYQEEEDPQAPDETRDESNLDQAEADQAEAEHEEDNGSIASTNTDDDEEVTEAKINEAITDTLAKLVKLHSLRQLGPVWQSMLAIKKEIESFVREKKFQKAYVKVLELKGEGDRAVSQTVRTLKRLGSKNKYKHEERERLLKLARQGDCLTFIKMLTEMKDDVHHAMMGGPPE